ncbi:fungal-specific transcription factor domain-containing protein [Stachybotrys elegans]|uniref:Fungal-specific transcription factor domain-containing protein n=1 Tax=Stachybotrys elegans TaxID=80388 RepID=A0A8K0SEC3_9HYPO|nr:fungal-specific transcription factor domain-containing protein [Stachybotrys elegans]
MDSNKDGPSRLTCENCRERKVKCNRQYPECSRCSRLGYQCTYRNRMSHRASQSAIINKLEERVREAEARLAMQTASNAAEASNPGSVRESSQSQPATSTSPASTAPSDPTPTAGVPDKNLTLDQYSEFEMSDFEFGSLDNAAYKSIFDQIQSSDMEIEDPINEWQTYIDPLPTPSSQAPRPPSSLRLSSQPIAPPSITSQSILSQDLSTLHQLFFDSYFVVIPILSKQRFYRELRLYPNSGAVKSLSYSIALLAITISESHKHLENSFYTKARRYINECDIEETGGPCSTINLLQALLFLTRYEVGMQKCAQSYLTLARASHLVKILRLDQIDRGGGSSPIENTAPYVTLPEMHDHLELEERRRCFWAWYLLEGYSGVHTGRPTMQDDATIFVSLPSPASLDSTSKPSSMPYITETNLVSNPEMLSPFSGAVLVASIVRKVLDHSWLCTQSGRQDNSSGFWDRHYSLLKLMSNFDALLHPFSTRLMNLHPLAFDLQILFHGAEIHLWEIAFNQGEKRGLPPPVNEESAKHLLAMAQKAAATICSTWSRHRPMSNKLSLSGAFVAWPICMAIKVFRTKLPISDAVDDDVCADMIQMLYKALGGIEKPDGPWHRSLLTSPLRQQDY